MSRKDTMLKAFLSNEEFCTKYNIHADPEITIFKAQQPANPVELIVLANIIDGHEADDTTSLYQKVINLLNSKK